MILVDFIFLLLLSLLLNRNIYVYTEVSTQRKAHLIHFTFWLKCVLGS